MIAATDLLPDHPRSRGVYRTTDIATEAGWRIIPARAGFTRVDGVGLEWPLGSSPLARGLLLCRLRGVPGGRIIPARAGFTTAAAT